MYRVIEVAKMLGVSKVTIYKKINKNKKVLKNHIHTRSNITYIDDFGVEIIKNTLELQIEPIHSNYSEGYEFKKNTIMELTTTLDLLNEQVRVKKRQIERKEEIIESSKSLLKSLRGKMQYLESKMNETK